MRKRAFIDKLRDFLLRRKVFVRKEEVTPLSPDTQEAIARKLNDMLVKRNAYLEAELAKARAAQEVKKGEAELGRVEEGLVKQATEEEAEEERLEKQNALKLRFVGIKKRPTLFLKGNKMLSKLAGFYLKDTDDGHLLIYPMIKDKAFSRERILDRPIRNIKELFKEPMNIVGQVRGGKVDSNYEINRDGKLIFIHPSEAEEEGTGRKVKIISISEQEKLEYERQIEELNDALQQLMQRIEDYEKMKGKYDISMAELRMQKNTAEKERDLWASKAAVAYERSVRSMRDLAASLTSVQDLKTQQALTEKMNRSLSYVIQDLNEKVEELAPKKIRDIERDRLKEDLKDLMDMSISLGAGKGKAATTPSVAPAPPPSEKGGGG